MTSPSPWGANANISLGNIVQAGTKQYSGFHFKCTTAGTTGSSEPEWPTKLGGTVVDNTVVWTAISSTFSSTNTLEPSAYIELFELHPVQALHNTSTPIRWHNGCNENRTGNITFGGLTYSRIPIEATGFERKANGASPRPTLTVANIDQTLTLLLNDVNFFNSGNDLGGAQVRRILTMKKFLDGESDADSSAFLPYEIWIVDRKASENMNTVTFELSTELDRPNAQVPKRELIGNCCQCAYRSYECSYTVSNYFDKNNNSVSSLADDVCGKRLTSCKARFGENAQLPFGAFPTAGRSQ